MLQKLFSWFPFFKKETQIDTRIYSKAPYAPVILDQETPVIPGVFPLEKTSSMGKDEKFDTSIMVLQQPDPGK